MSADICLSTTPGLDVYQWKRSPNVRWYVHITHSAWDINCYRMFGLDYYDAVLLNGEFQAPQIRELEKLRNLPAKELKVIGLTYLDEIKKRAEKVIINNDAIKTVLLAPSWGPNSILVKYGEDIIKNLLKTGYRIIIRPHPQSIISDKKYIEPLRKKYPDGEMLSWNFDNDNFDVLNRSDIMISDFSGVIFDFVLVFDKPLIYADTSFDRAVYDAAWSEKPLWIFETLPRIGLPLKPENLPKIKDEIDGALHNRGLEEGRKRAREEAWANMGRSAEMVADYLIEKHNKLKSDSDEEKT